MKLSAFCQYTKVMFQQLPRLRWCGQEGLESSRSSRVLRDDFVRPNQWNFILNLNIVHFLSGKLGRFHYLLLFNFLYCLLIVYISQFSLTFQDLPVFFVWALIWTPLCSGLDVWSGVALTLAGPGRSWKRHGAKVHELEVRKVGVVGSHDGSMGRLYIYLHLPTFTIINQPFMYVNIPFTWILFGVWSRTKRDVKDDVMQRCGFPSSDQVCFFGGNSAGGLRDFGKAGQSQASALGYYGQNHGKLSPDSCSWYTVKMWIYLIWKGYTMIYTIFIYYIFWKSLRFISRTSRLQQLFESKNNAKFSLQSPEMQ